MKRLDYEPKGGRKPLDAITILSRVGILMILVFLLYLALVMSSSWL